MQASELKPNWQRMYENAVEAIARGENSATQFKRHILKEYIHRVAYRKYISSKPKDARLIDLYKCSELGHLKEQGSTKCLVCKYG